MAHLDSTWRHIRRSPYQAFAAIFIMMQTFFVVTLFTFIIFGSSVIISYFESIPQVTAFFKDEAKQAEIDALQDQVEQTGKIASVEFVSKQDALKIYREQNKEDPLLLDLVTADILPSALKISTVKIEDLKSISDLLGKSSIVQRVVFLKDVVDTLSVWTDAIRKMGIGLILILGLDAIFVMVIIIGIKISQKRKEIEIMRLLGATSWYIRWPFVLEGIIYGAIGAVFGWALASGALVAATPLLQSFLRGIPLLPVSPLFLGAVLVGELALAVLLGVASSLLAVLRYLK